MKAFKNIVFATVLLVFAVMPAMACINVELRVGLVDTPEGHLIADIVSILILERSGVKADISYYADSKELDQAAVDKQVDIMIENTNNAMAVLAQPLAEDLDQNIMTAKILYKRDKGLIWLKPFGYRSDGGANGALVTKEILDKFPGMPRVLGKLSGAIDDATWSRLTGLVEQGAKTSKVAKDFLVAKKFI